MTNDYDAEDMPYRRDYSFDRKLEEIFDSLRAQFFSKGDSGDDTVYHYTSPDGLIGILKDGQLRATSIRHFKGDPSELRYAETVYRGVIDEIAVECSSNALKSQLAKACQLEPPSTPRRESSLGKGPGMQTTWWNKVLDIYVTCFSTRNDLLHQWKNYACGGAGFSIGFDRRKLTTAIQRPAAEGTTRPSIHLAKVRYSEKEQKEELRQIFDRYCVTISEASPACYIGRCADAIVKALALHASLFKRPDFELEQEWRIIIETLPGGSDLCFRSSVDMVIPYMKTAKQETGRLPANNVTIGPAMNQEASRLGVQALLDKVGYRGVRILSSLQVIIG